MKATTFLLLAACLLLGAGSAQAQSGQPAKSAPPTVFLGDSMLFGFANFPELTPPDTVNLAQTMSTSAGAAQIAPTAATYQPRSLFVMTGINDIPRGDIDSFSRNYETILSAVESGSPGTRVYAQAIFPVNFTDFPASKQISNAQVQEYNAAIQGVTARHPRTTYLDFTPSFTDAKGNMKKELTVDGLHPSVEGYALWSRLMGPYF